MLRSITFNSSHLYTTGIDVSDLCVPFEDYEGEYNTNAKRLIEMRKRLEAAK